MVQQFESDTYVELIEKLSNKMRKCDVHFWKSDATTVSDLAILMTLNKQ